jgi:hypothetical protein
VQQSREERRLPCSDEQLGRPPDYFDHVMLASGKCTAPEGVAVSRSLGRDVQSPDLRAGYECAVRFYFRWSELAKRDDARFDGVHVLKVMHQIELEEALVAVVVHANKRGTVLPRVHPSIRDRVVLLESQSPTPGEWASAALAIAEAMCK